nr:unnamed protein product [Callosobruchus analis]
MQKSLQQQTKTKVTAPADTSTSIPAGGGLLTTVDKQKDMLQNLPKDKQSVNESVWYWLKTQQSMMNLNQTPSTLSTLQNSNGISSSTPTATNTVSSTQFPGSMTADQSSWFWKWYKQFAYGQQLPQDTKPILYQQLTKEPKAVTPPPPPKLPTPPLQLHQPLLQTVPVPDQQNAENLSVQDEKQKQTDKSNNNKVRSVLDNLLFNNNNNVAVNRKETRDEEEELSQSEAVEHGEKFLQWLETCSDPSVTAMQIMQFRTLLNNVKSGADRKNGDLQNKTKVKRK